MDTPDGAFTPTCERPTDLLRPRRIDPKGIEGPTWRVANGPRWERLSHGLYVPRGQRRPDSPEQRIVEAAARLPRDGSSGCVTGWAALRWRGATYFDGNDADGQVGVEVAPGAVGHPRSAPGVLARRGRILECFTEIVDDVPLAPVQRALFDEIHTRDDLWRAVVAIDMAAAAGLVSVWLFATYLAEMNSRNGAPLARHACSLAVDESRSPRESWMRLVWRLDAGLDEPLVNQPVFDLGGNLVGVPDLFDPTTGLAGEYDGAAHRSRERHSSDVARAERFRAVGIEQVVAVAGDSRATVANRLRAAHTRIRSRGISDAPAWTLDPPSWFRVPETLEARLERLGLVESLTRVC